MTKKKLNSKQKRNMKRRMAEAKARKRNKGNNVFLKDMFAEVDKFVNFLDETCAQIAVTDAYLKQKSEAFGIVDVYEETAAKYSGFVDKVKEIKDKIVAEKDRIHTLEQVTNLTIMMSEMASEVVGDVNEVQDNMTELANVVEDKERESAKESENGEAEETEA